MLLPGQSSVCASQAYSAEVRVGLTVAAVLGAVALTVGLVLAVAESPEDDVRVAAQQLVEALDRGDGAKVCSLLAHPERVAKDGRSCQDVAEDKLEVESSPIGDPSVRIHHVSVSGDTADVETRAEDGSGPRWKFIKRDDGWKWTRR